MPADKDIEQRFDIAVRLALGASRRPATPDCLTPEVIAAYYVYALNRVERLRCQAHISECSRCQETLDALTRAKPEDRISPEAASRGAEAEVVEPGSAPPWRLKPADPPAFDFRRLWRVGGIAIVFAAIVSVVILADVQMYHGNEAGESARVASFHAGVRRHVRRRVSPAPNEDELALNEVRPQPAASPAAVEPSAPSPNGPPSATIPSAPANVYSNPLFRGAPPATAQQTQPPAAPDVPHHEVAQSSANPPAPVTSSANRAQVASAAAPGPSVAPVARAAPTAAPQSAPPSASKPVAAAPNPNKQPAATSTAAVPHADEIARRAEHASAAKTANALAKASNASESAAATRGTRAPTAHHVAKAIPRQRTPVSARERVAHRERERLREAIAMARAHRTEHSARIEHARVASRAVPSAPEVERVAGNQQPGVATARTDLVVASAPPISVLPAVAPVARGIPVAPRAALVASPDNSVYWSLQDFGIIYRSTNRRSWVQLPSGTRDDLLAGAAPSRMVCWAVGRHGVILLTTDGAHWSTIKSPTSADLVGVEAASADVATVVTRDGQRFSTFDGGSNWQPGRSEASAWRHAE